MKNFIYLMGCLMISSLSLADDTEIYGATAIDEDSRVNSNVLFIMDTSGSMRGTVTSTHAVYDPSTDYSGGYDSYPTDVYHDLYSSTRQGHKLSSLDSNTCGTELNTLSNIGKVQGKFIQNNKNSLKNGSDKTITCGSGGVYILHTSNYMNWYHYGGKVSSTRMEIVVDVVKELTNSLTNINLGLMRFDGNSDGGMIDVPISDISTSGPLIKSKLDSYYPNGGTPLEETMYEAARYYRGEEWYFGNDSWPNSSVSGSRQGVASTTYKSPIEESCQKNHIILLTDGEPSSDSSANSRIRSLIASSSLPSGLNKSCSGNGECLDELAYWLKNEDHSATQAGSQPITTYTIGGFGLANGVALLKNTADFGGGRYFAADDTAELTEALESIFLDILSTDSTFTAPAVSVNAFNASEHRDDLFYALFRPAENVKWAGNLKKYRLTEDGIVEGDEVGVPAISEATGFFNEGVSDMWNDTDIPDGKKIDEGGVANILPDPISRKIWTNTETAKQMVTFEAGSSATSFDVPEDDFENTYLWSIGVDIDNSILDEESSEYNVVNRHEIGDPLHSEPVIATYGSHGGDINDPDSTIFFGTNEGFIHAIDTKSGLEQFAFIPRDLHKTQKTYFNNNSPVADKPYGMDGKITTWFQDKNQDSLLDDDEHIFLYSGMRRGGRNYYGLDVSDRNEPKMLFEILGGTGEFEELGQTWAGMTVARVFMKDTENNAKVEKDVLIFSGGYDENQDLASPALASDKMGRAIYIVDATSGSLLAWIGGPDSKGTTDADLTIDEMKNSIPASVSAIDITGDGVIDYLFAADTAGKVFRVDLHYDNGLKFTGGMIANLGSSAPGAHLVNDNRRFYNKPNVALVKDKQKGDYLTIAIGSGHRAHPILTTAVKNRFYVLKDKNIETVSTSYNYVSLTEEDPGEIEIGDTAANIAAAKKKVFNASPLMNGVYDPLTVSGAASISKMKNMLSTGGGWYITLDTEGEKVLAESTTFSGAVIFTSFSKSGISSSTCGPDTGMAKIYVLDQKWAEPAIDLNNDGKIDENDSSKVLSHSGIAPRPVVIYRKGGKKTIAIGTEAIEDSRFTQGAANPEDCTTDCKKVISECEGSNCSVTPVYWHE